MSSHALPHDDDDDDEVQLTGSHSVIDAVGARIAQAEESGRVVELGDDGKVSDDDIPLCVWQKREEDKRRFFSRLPLREIQKCLEFLQFDLVDTAMRSVSKATLAAARLALTCGRWRPIRYVAEQGLAVCANVSDFNATPPDDACATFRKAWALDSRLTFRVMCDWPCSLSRLREYGAVFLSIVVPSRDGLPSIVAACEDAYLIRSAGPGPYILGRDHHRRRDGISYPSHTRESGPYCFPWPMVRTWEELVLGASPSYHWAWAPRPLIVGAGLEAWADQQLAATFTRDCLYYTTRLHSRVDTNLLEPYARAWSARWEDRTKAGAFVAAMGRIREVMVRQYEDDMERRLEQRRMRGEYGSDSDEEDY